MSEQQPTYGGQVTSDAQQALAEITGYFAIIPEELLESHNPSAIVLYGILDRIASEGEGFASMTILTQRTGLSEATIRRARNFLVDHGWLIITRIGSGRLATDYRLPFQMNKGRGAKRDTPGVPNEIPQGCQIVTTKQSPITETIKQSPVFTIKDEPEWFQTLSEDKRWTGKNPEKYTKAIEEEFPHVNLALEAHAAYEWLQSPAGLKKKVLRGFWKNWLKKTQPKGISNDGTESASDSREFFRSLG